MKVCILLILLTLAFTAGDIASAQTYSDAVLKYQPVVQIPGLNPKTQTTDQYVNALYLLSITVAALLAVVKIIFGGVKWMLSDVVTDKSSAKKDMWGAVLGLLIVLSAVLILNTINSDLTKLNFLENAEPLSITLGQYNTNEVEKVTCQSGEVFKVTVANPAGTCVKTTGTDIPEEVLEDEEVTPSNLNSYCAVQVPGSKYNPVTKQCEVDEYAVFVPEEDIEDGRGPEFCFTYQMQFDAATKRCIPYN